MQERLNDAKRRMEGAGKALAGEFATVRTGRASTGLLDRVTVEAYGTRTPLNQLAGVNTPEPRLITVQPYDPSILGAIEKALMESDIGMTPSNDGKIIRLPVPQLTEERRKELVKQVKGKGEDAKVSIRNVRRKANDQLAKIVKDGDAGEDDVARAEKELDKTTAKYVAQIEDLVARKEADLMEV